MFRKAVLMVAVSALLAPCAFAQDTESEDEAATLVGKALDRAAASGGIVLKGNLKRESPLRGMGVMLGGMGGGDIEGDFTLKIGNNGTSSIIIENEKGRIEVYRKGGKTVHRQTWSGKQPAVGEFGKEVNALLNLKALKAQLRKAKKVRFAGEKKVGDSECRVVKGVFSGDLLANDDEDEDEEGGPMNFRLKMFEVKNIEATFYIDKETGALRKIEMSVNKGYSSMIRGAMKGRMPGMEDEDEDEEDEGDEEEDDPGMGGFNLGAMKFSSNYTFTIQKFDKDLKVEIPKELRKFFEE